MLSSQLFHFTSRKTIMHVMSSMLFSSALHLLYAALTRASAAPSAFFLAKYGKTIFATY